jgi:hypothetical protein
MHALFQLLIVHALCHFLLQETARPVRWTFLWSGAEFHTMEWDEGAMLDNKMWQAPDYCFNQPSPAEGETSELIFLC